MAFEKLKHLFGYHFWVYSPGGNRRACRICGRREVVTFRSRYMTTWSEHTYPLNADPTKDPTPICRDGFVSTLGVEETINKVFDSLTTHNLRN